MSLMRKRLISLLLSVCVVIGLLPVLPAAAVTVNTNADPSQIFEIQSGDAYPGDFTEGLVYKFNDLGSGMYRIDLSGYNLNSIPFRSMGTRLLWDNDTVMLSDPAGTEDVLNPSAGNSWMTCDSAIESLPVENAELLTATGTGAGKLTVNSPIYGDAKSLFTNIQFSTREPNAGVNLANGKVFNLDIVVNDGSGPPPPSAMYKTIDTTTYNFTAPASVSNVNFLSVYFKVREGKTVTDATFGMDKDETYPNGAGFKKNDSTMLSTKTLFVGFPAAAEATRDVTFTVKADTTPIEGAILSLTGTSKAGTVIDTVSPATNASGQCTIALPDSNASGYKFTVADTAFGGKSYTMTADDKAGVTFTVTPTTTDVTYTKMKEVSNAFPIRVMAFDKSDTPVNLTGATLKFGGALSPVDFSSKISGNGASFTTASSGSGLVLQLSNIEGYRNLTGSTVQINVEPKGGSLTEATLSAGSFAGSTAHKVSIETDGTGQYIKLVLAKSITNVTVPVPVPQLDGVAITSDQAKAMTLTFTAKDAASAALKAEIGAGIVVKDSAITVTDAPARAAGALAASITGVAALPDGAYDMSIGGAGFDAKKLDVTVITDFTASPYVRYANVGGVASLDGSGNVTGVTGGVTVSKADTSASSDTGSVTLIGTTAGGSGTIIDGGDIAITGGTPSISGGTDASADGLLSTVTGGGMTPSVVTDPIYQVEVTDVRVDSNIKNLKLQVYLSNAKTSAGTFGLYFDPKIIDTLAASNIALNTGVFYSTAVNAGVPEVGNNHKGSSYLAFSWDVGNPSTPALDATTERKLLATITVPVKSAYWTETEFIKNVDQRAIYAMDYALTIGGEKIIADHAADEAALNEHMSAVWRNISMTGTAGCVTLANDKATRGGFYQISAEKTVEAGVLNVSHDIRMDIKLPAIFQKQRADFFVTERDVSVGVDDAIITIYGEAYDPTAATPVAPLFETPLKTADGGFAHVALDSDKTYWYTVSESGHWAYPDGTALTDSDDLHCDSFELTARGATPKTGIVLVDGVRKPTAIYNEFINPRMDPQSYHKVDLASKDNPNQAATATITSTQRAYNGVDYLFSITPENGREWDVGTAGGEAYASMTAVAAAMTAKLYVADKDDAQDKWFQSGTATDLTVTWDTAKEQFLVLGNSITGAAIGVDTVGTDTAVDALRAGDVMMLVPDNAMRDANYTITATPGVGGKVKLDLDATVTTGKTDQTAAVPLQGTPIAELLSERRTTSSKYTFKGDGANTIDKIYVNGIEIYAPEEQKTAGFTYQFANISADQNIYVTFKDADGVPLSDAALTLSVGSKGSVAVAATGVTDTLTGPANKSYVISNTTDGLNLTVQAATDYEIDTVLLNGTAQDLTSAKETDGFYTKPFVLAVTPLEKNTVHSVVVTFKPKGMPSTQAIVTAKVVYGMGVLAPVGVSIYPIGSTPIYAMSPSNKWTVLKKEDAKSIILDGVSDKSLDIVAPTVAGNPYTYTMPTLTGNVLLDAKFAEKSTEVKGSITTQTTRITGDKIAPATLTFVRAAVATVSDETKIVVTSSDTVTGTAKLSFDANIPEGTWTVTVRKPGYLEYTIKDFVVASNASEIIYFGDAASAGGTVAGDSTKIKSIELLVGDANGEGLVVAANDAHIVVSGWILDAKPLNKVRADLNESSFTTGGGSDTADMALVGNNIGKARIINKAYGAFCAATPAP